MFVMKYCHVSKPSAADSANIKTETAWDIQTLQDCDSLNIFDREAINTICPSTVKLLGCILHVLAILPINMVCTPHVHTIHQWMLYKPNNFYVKQIKKKQPSDHKLTVMKQTHDLIDLRHTSIEGGIKDPCLRDPNKNRSPTKRSFTGSQQGSLYPIIVFNVQWCFIVVTSNSEFERK